MLREVHLVHVASLLVVGISGKKEKRLKLNIYSFSGNYDSCECDVRNYIMNLYEEQRDFIFNLLHAYFPTLERNLYRIFGLHEKIFDLARKSG